MLFFIFFINSHTNPKCCAPNTLQKGSVFDAQSIKLHFAAKTEDMVTLWRLKGASAEDSVDSLRYQSLHPGALSSQ